MTERKIEELEFKAAVEVDGDLYFSAWCTNALFKQDGETGKIVYLGRVAEESQEWNLHGSAYYYNECIYFIPLAGKYIAKLHLKDPKIEAIAIPGIGEKEYAVRFFSSVRADDEIWIIPYEADKMFKLNLRTDEVELCVDWTAERQTKTNLFWDGICISNYLCLCPADYPYFVTYDLNEKKLHNWEWAYPPNAFSKMIYHKDILWFLPDGTYPHILKYSLKEQSTVLIALPKGVVDNMDCAWGGAVLMGDTIIFPPYESNYWLMLDTDTNRIEYVPFEANGKLENYRYPLYQFMNYFHDGVIVMGDQCEEGHFIAGKMQEMRQAVFVMDETAKSAYMRDIMLQGATKEIVFREKDISLQLFLNTLTEE